MILTCDGRRMPPQAVASLITAINQLPLSDLMQREGYTLNPVHAPRGRTNGDLVLRLTWSKAEANATIIVRSTVRLRAPK